MIQRQILQHAVKTLRLFPAIALLGPRQAGKTTLAKQLIKASIKETIYLDLENPDDAFILSNPMPFFRENKNKCIVIDEVQRMPALFPILRSAIDEHRKNGRFILLGSASPVLLLSSAESLAGRIMYHELTPFILQEVLPKYNQERLLLRGGYPLPFLSKTNDAAALWQQSFLATYVERDLPALGLGTPANILMRLFRMLAHIHGQVINYSQLAAALGVSSPTVATAVNYLENAFLIRRLPPYFSNAKKRIVKSPKIYIRDTGILLHLLQVKTLHDLLSHPQCGAVWEGFVIEQTINTVKNKYEATYYRTQDGAETDLVLLKTGKPVIAIEIKWSNSPALTKGTYKALADMKTKINFVVTPGPNKAAYKLYNQLAITSLQDMLGKL